MRAAQAAVDAQIVVALVDVHAAVGGDGGVVEDGVGRPETEPDAGVDAGRVEGQKQEQARQDQRQAQRVQVHQKHRQLHLDVKKSGKFQRKSRLNLFFGFF